MAAPTYTWFGCDLVTGKVIDELPIRDAGLPSLIGAYSTTTATLTIPDAPIGWEAATDPGRTLLVCSRDGDEVIVGGGIVTGREGGSGPEVSLGLVSVEGYLDRRYVPSVTYTETDEATIASNLVALAATEGIGFVVDAPPTGTLRDRAYDGTTDQSIYQQLTELSGVEDGPEWTVALRWNATRTVVEKVFTVRKRLGTQSAPTAVFDFPGNVKDYTLSESFASDTGANHIEVFGEGEGENRPASAPTRDEALLGFFPRYELREIRSGASVVATLNAHARETLALTARGARTVTVEADADSAPAFRTDWNLGDLVALDVASSPRHPGGLYLEGRVIGADLDPSPGGSVSPIILLDS